MTEHDKKELILEVLLGALCVHNPDTVTIKELIEDVNHYLTKIMVDKKFIELAYEKARRAVYVRENPEEITELSDEERRILGSIVQATNETDREHS